MKDLLTVGTTRHSDRLEIHVFDRWKYQIISKPQVGIILVLEILILSQCLEEILLIIPLMKLVIICILFLFHNESVSLDSNAMGITVNSSDFLVPDQIMRCQD